MTASSTVSDLPTTAGGRDIHVMASGALKVAYDSLISAFELGTGHRLTTAFGESMGTAANSISMRLSRGDAADVLILARSALDALVAQGSAVPGSQVDLAYSSIGMAVKTGLPTPDIGTVEALKRALLEAPSIAYSASASGLYYSTGLVQRLGIEAQVMPKSKRIVGEWVGTAVARGDAVLGLAQVSELLQVQGVDMIGLLPHEVQKITIFSAGISTTAREPEAARQLVDFLASMEAAPAIAKAGLQPTAVSRVGPD